MTQNIKNFIEEGEKEVDNYFCASDKGGDGFAHLNDYDRNKIKQFISSRQISLIKMIVDSIKLPEYDHSKCPIKDTCIGYQNAESDLEHIKADLLSELTDGK